MSGLNKQRKLFKKQLFIIFTVYIIFFVAISLILTNIPTINNKIMNDKVVKIKKEIETSLNKENVLTTKFNNLTKEDSMQLVIKKGDEIVYSNMPINDYNLLSNVVDKDLVFYKASYTYDNYDIWLLLYNKTDQNLTYTIIIAILIFIILSIIFLIRLSFNSLMKPLEGLYSNIKKLKDYKLDGVLTIDQKTDLFAQELKEFALDIKDKVEDFEVVYSNLEKELILQNKNTEYKTNVIASLVHDLKTPISMIKISTVKLEKVTTLDKNALKTIDESADKIVRDVDEILNISYKEDIKHEKEIVDLSSEIKKYINDFSKLYQDKGLFFNNEIIPEAKIIFLKMELETILKNIFTNAYTYSSANSEVDVQLEEDNDKYILKVSNEVDDNNKIDYENAFKVLNKDLSNKTSSGVGLYIVKQFVEKNNGKCLFYQSEKGVTIELVFTKGESNYEENN